jgi:hypothetical protein
MEKLLLFYLTSNDRPFVFEKFVNEIKKTNYLDKIKLLIVNSSSDFKLYDDCLKQTDISYEMSHVDCPQSNYLPKVRYAINYAKSNGYKYIMKYDSDVLMPTYTFDYIMENLNILNNESNLTIGPMVTTGIPSVEAFIDDFMIEEEQLKIRDEFKKCVFHIQPGIMDYTPLNKCTISNTNKWDGKYYYDSLNNYIDGLIDIGNGRTPNGYCKFYRGMHPIRHGFGNEMLNDIIIKNKERFFQKKPCSLIENESCKQLMAMCFVILADNYDRIINHENLLIDGCDEVPINRFAWNNNLSHLIVNSGYAIHITYNWRWHLNEKDGGSNITKPEISLGEFEEKFISQL